MYLFVSGYINTVFLCLYALGLSEFVRLFDGPNICGRAYPSGGGGVCVCQKRQGKWQTSQDRLTIFT